MLQEAVAIQTKGVKLVPTYTLALQIHYPLAVLKIELAGQQAVVALPLYVPLLTVLGD